MTEITDPQSVPGRRRWVLLNWRNARRLLIGLAVIATLIGVYYTVENWRGRRAWSSFVADMTARGEPLTIAELLPPTPPADENLASIPLLQPFLDYTHGPDGQNTWRDPEAYRRLSELHFVRRVPDNGWSNRERGRLTDFVAWQHAFRNDTNYHVATNRLSAPVLHEVAGVSGMTELRYDTNQAVSEVQLFLGTYDEIMDALHAAAGRTHCHFPVHYEEGFSALLPHWQFLRHIGRVGCLKAATLLAQDRPADALKELRLIIRLSKGADAEPILISQLVRMAMLNIVANVVWEGMRTGRWTDAELRDIEADFRGTDMTMVYLFAMRGERVLALHGLDRLRREPGALGDDEATMTFFNLGPSGWYQQNLVTFGRMFDEFVFPFVDVEQRRFFLREGRAKSADLEERLRHFDLHTILTKLALAAYEKVLTRMAYAQVSADQLRLACAIERYRLAHQRLPEKLTEVSALLGTPLPKDPTNGEDYRYRPDAQTAAYRIWSPGADGKDDNGQIEWREDEPERREKDHGDWVWQY